MNITRENKGELSAYLKLELFPQDYEGKVADELKSYRHKVQLKGFRQGQVPASLIKKMYGKAILMDQVNKLIGEGIDNYIKENKINIIGNALAVPEEEKKSEFDFDNPGTFTVWFEIGLAPEFKVELDKVNVTSYQIKVDDEQVNKQVEALCRRYGKVESPETVGAEDTLGGEIFELDEKGEIKEGGIHTKTSIAVDMIALKTIQKQFIGKKVEATVDFEIHKAFKNKTDLSAMLHIAESELDNISPRFRYRIDSITHVEPASVDADLFAKVFPQSEIKDEAAFREEVRKDIAKYYSQNTEKKLFVDTVDTIIDQTSFELPADFIKRWVLTESNHQAEEKKEAPVTEIPEEEMKQILRSLRWELIQNQITSQYGMKIEMEDLRAFYRDRVLSQYFPVNSEDEETKKRIDMFIDSMMKNQEEVKRVYDMVFEEKLTEIFKKHAKLNTKEVSMDEFVNILQAAQAAR